MWRRVNRLGDKFIPRIREHAAFGGDGAKQSIEHEKSARDGPAVTDARRHAAPVVTAELCSSRRYDFRDLFDRVRINTGFFGGEVECVLGIEFFKDVFEVLEALMSDKLQFVARGAFGAWVFE